MGASPTSVAVGAVAVTSLLLLGIALGASWLAGWYAERARRVLAAVRRGEALRAGFGAVHGTARRADGRAGGLLARTTTTQVRFAGGSFVDSDTVTEGAPFVVVLGSGEEIEVDPREAVVEDGQAPDPPATFTRERVSRVGSGDQVWVTGLLSPRREPGAGAYRSTVTRRRIAAPRGAPVRISTESPLPRWEALARAHQWGAYLALVAGALAHGILFRRVDATLLSGGPSSGLFTDHDPSAMLLVSGGALAVVAVASIWRQRIVRAHAGRSVTRGKRS